MFPQIYVKVATKDGILLYSQYHVTVNTLDELILPEAYICVNAIASAEVIAT